MPRALAALSAKEFTNQQARHASPPGEEEQSGAKATYAPALAAAQRQRRRQRLPQRAAYDARRCPRLNAPHSSAMARGADDIRHAAPPPYFARHHVDGDIDALVPA